MRLCGESGFDSCDLTDEGITANMKKREMTFTKAKMQLMTEVPLANPRSCQMRGEEEWKEGRR
jgi:hypothetical protein